MPRKILLADDSVTAQNMGRKILVDAGYEVITVNNGSAALKRVNESKPDLVVLDVYMPGYSGLEVCQRIKEAAETADIPVLLTVGKLEPFKPDEARRARADAHIVKPFEASELLSALARLEDRIAVSGEQQKANRKAAGDNSSAANNGSDSWRDRLRFSAKKKDKKETQNEAAGNFHDFRRTKAKPASEPAPVAKSSTTEKDAAVIPDIPRDITADELDALSAVAASLPGATTSPQPGAPAAEGEAAYSRQVTPETETPAAHMPAVELSSVAPAIEAVRLASFVQQPAPIDRQDEPIFAAAPVTQKEFEAPTADAIAASEQAAAGERSETNAEELVAANATLAEPRFEEPNSQHTGTAESRVQEFTVQESKPEETPLAVAHVNAPTTEEATTAVVAEQAASAEPVPPAPTALSMQEAAEPVGPPPSDEELAQALRLLTPATGYSGPPMPWHEALAAAGQLLVAKAASDAASEPRWIAEPVALTPEESSISLEAEMFGKFVADAAGETTAPVASQIATGIEPSPEAVSEPGPSPVSGVSVVESVLEAATHSPYPPDNFREQAPAATFADMLPAHEVETASAAQATATHALIAEEIITQGTTEPALHFAEGEVPAHVQTATPETSVVEAAIQAEAAEALKTMAAAASADGASTAATDPNEIASIVESVLADLRPKIVEEITKKLSRK